MLTEHAQEDLSMLSVNQVRAKFPLGFYSGELDYARINTGELGRQCGR
jgi:hypothetical protein